MGLYALSNTFRTSTSLPTLIKLGFGAVDPRTIMAMGVDRAFENTLIANSPQIMASFIYFLYNSVFTNMLLGHEWATYSYKRKGLRVTTEGQGSQRSSYFLSLPYRWAIPLMATSSLMHWVVSQSIFFVIIEVSLRVPLRFSKFPY